MVPATEHQATNGKYAGDVTEDQLKALDRDLQTQVRVILSKQTGIPQDQKRAAQQRMGPLFGPAAQGSGNSPASPPAPAAATTPPASSPAAGGNLSRRRRSALESWADHHISVMASSGL